ncbi:MAG: YwaF family protein [Clostridia bacterium]
MAIWVFLTLLLAHAGWRGILMRCLITGGLAVSMLTQVWLLWLDGQLSLATALPLHLCSLFGVLSAALVWLRPLWLFHLSLLLGAPCAFMALCFPAVIDNSRQFMMSLAFYRLHTLILCAPLLLAKEGLALPTNAQGSFLLANGYLLFVALFNRLFTTNYLFLAAAPAGTPLAALFARGEAFYVCALELCAMLVMAWLAHLYAWLCAHSLRQLA